MTSQAEKWTFQRHGKYIGKAIAGTNLLFLSSLSKGRTLNLCCGFDNSGHVLVDVDGEILRERQATLSDRDIINADAFHLPFREESFDTVIIDPPFSFYQAFAWIFNIFRLARKRVIMSAPTVDIRPPEGWTRDLYYIGSNHFLLRLWWVFDKTQTEIKSMEHCERKGCGSICVSGSCKDCGIAMCYMCCMSHCCKKDKEARLV